MSLLTRKMPIWPTCWKKFYQRPTINRSISVTDKKFIYLGEKLSSFFPYRHATCSFDSPAKKNARKPGIFQLTPQNYVKINNFFEKKLCSENVFSDAYYAILTTPSEKNSEQGQNTSVEKPRMMKKSNFSSFLPQLLYFYPADTQNEVLTTQPEIICQRATTFSPIVWKW